MIEIITKQLHKNKISEKEWPLARTNAHLDVLEELSRKIRSKLVLIEEKPLSSPLTYSISKIQAFILVANKDICKGSNQKSYLDPFSQALLEEISVPVFQKLLS